MQTRNRKILAIAWMFLLTSLTATPLIAETGRHSSGDFSKEDLAEFAGRMQEEVETLRGWKFKHPVDVGLYTEEQVNAFIEEPLAGEGGWSEQSRAEAAMKMIGLIPQDSGLLGTTRKMLVNMSPPGIYDAGTKELRVVKKPGMDFSSVSLQTIFIHELTHALDDQYFDLQCMEEIALSSRDAEIVIGSVVEGSAITVQQRYLNKVFLSGKADRAQVLQSMSSAMGDMQAVFNVPLYFATFFARFAIGAAFLQFGAETLSLNPETSTDSTEAENAVEPSDIPRGMGPALKCVGEAMQAATADLPRSSEQILHPEKYWRKETMDEPIVVRDGDFEELITPEGLYVVHKDTFGELRIAVLTFPQGKRISPADMPLLPDAWTNVGAAGWGGDRFFLLATRLNEDMVPLQHEQLFGVWFTMWDTADDCKEFIAQYEKHRPSPSRDVIVPGNRCAVFLFNFESPQEGALKLRLLTSPPGFTQGGKSWAPAAAGTPGDAK